MLLRLQLRDLPGCNPTRFQCPNLDWNFKICGTKFGLNLDLRKNDYFIKNALPWRNIKISMIQVNFGKVWPSLILVRTDTIFSSFGTRVFLEVLVPKLEKVVTVRTKFRLGHSFSKLAWIREIFTQRHGNAFLLEWSFLLKFKISPNLVLKISKFQSKFGHRNRVGHLWLYHQFTTVVMRCYVDEVMVDQNDTAANHGINLRFVLSMGRIFAAGTAGLPREHTGANY